MPANFAGLLANVAVWVVAAGYMPVWGWGYWWISGRLIFLFRAAYCGGMWDCIRRLLAWVCLLLPAAGALSQVKPEELQCEKAKGTVVESVKCGDASQQSYALYLPARYSPDQRWPGIYAFDPGGPGARAVEAYEAAAEKYGYIVAASNNSRNGPAQAELAAEQAVWKDTHERFSIDANRIYTTGFSGGAKAATYFALYCSSCHVAGVIAQGAGYPTMNNSIVPANDHFAYYAAIGEDDFNFPDVMALRRKKDEQGAQFKVGVYAGSHQWAPPAIAEDAIAWMELKAMQSGVEKVDAAFVQRMFEQTQVDASQADKAGDVVGRYYALRSLAWDFKGLEDVTSYKSELAEVRESAAWKKASREEQGQIDLQASLTAKVSGELGQLGAVDEDAQAGLAARIASEMGNLRSMERSKGKDQVVESRAFAELWMEGIEAGEEQFQSGRYHVAATYFSLMAEVAPDEPMPLVLLAEARVRMGNKKQALKALQEAGRRGSLHAKTLTDDPELRPLASDPAFQEIVRGLP